MNGPTMKQKQAQGQREQTGSCQGEKGVGERWIGGWSQQMQIVFTHTRTHTQTHILFHYGLSQDTHRRTHIQTHILFHYGLSQDTHGRTHTQTHILLHYGLSQDTHGRTHTQTHILLHYGLSQDIEYSSLCSTVGACCLSILLIYINTISIFNTY